MKPTHTRYDSSGFSRARGETLVADLEIFLGDLCRHWGFCNRLSAKELLSVGTLTASDFATAVLTSEGFEPDIEPAWRRELQRVFVDRYGTDRISGYLQERREIKLK